jgi:hypothetical protein
MIANKNDRLRLDTLLSAGLQKHLGDNGFLVFDGKKYSTADLVKVLQERVGATHEVTTTRAAHAKAVAVERAKIAETKKFVANIRQVLKVMYSNSVDVLTDLGLRAPSRKPPTLDAKVAAIAKTLATRAARHTMGPRQRQRIHGVPVPSGKPADRMGVPHDDGHVDAPPLPVATPPPAHGAGETRVAPEHEVRLEAG